MKLQATTLLPSTNLTDETRPAATAIGDMLVQHYSPGELLENVEQAIQALGKSTATVTIDDLAPMDEFHVGGREATQALLAPLNISSNHHLLDVGSGVGGAARFVAAAFACKVSGFDFTAEFVNVGQQLSAWLGLDERVSLQQADALALPVEDNSYDGAYMLHVGMNIDDKLSLSNEIHRVLKPGGFFAIYDLMRIGDGEITFPVPWSGSEESSFVVTPAEYRHALQRAGFRIVQTRNRQSYALDFYARMKQQLESTGAQAMGLHLLMGEAAARRLANAYAAIEAATLAPVEIVAIKAS